MAPCTMNEEFVSPGCTREVKKITCFALFLLGACFSAFSPTSLAAGSVPKFS